MKNKKKNLNYPYPRIKAKWPKEDQQLFLNHQKEFASWNDEEKKKRGFGSHGHPRRLFIFIDRYFTEVKYFMTDEEREKFVFPWVCATRSERKKALKLNPVYFRIKKTTLKLAQRRYEIKHLEQELKKTKYYIK